MTKAERIEKDVKRHNIILDTVKEVLVELNKATKNGDDEKAWECRHKYDGMYNVLFESEDMWFMFTTIEGAFGDEKTNRIDGFRYRYNDVEGGYHQDYIAFTEEELYK